MYVLSVFLFVLSRRMYNIYPEPGTASTVSNPGSSQSKFWAGQEPSSSSGQLPSRQCSRDSIRSPAHITHSRLWQTERYDLGVCRQGRFNWRESLWVFCHFSSAGYSLAELIMLSGSLGICLLASVRLLEIVTTGHRNLYSCTQRPIVITDQILGHFGYLLYLPCGATSPLSSTTHGLRSVICSHNLVPRPGSSVYYLVPNPIVACIYICSSLLDSLP